MVTAGILRTVHQMHEEAGEVILAGDQVLRDGDGAQRQMKVVWRGPAAGH